MLHAPSFTRSAASACTHNDDEGMLSFCAIFPHARQSRHGQGDRLTAPERLAHCSNSRSKPLSSSASCLTASSPPSCQRSTSATQCGLSAPCALPCTAPRAPPFPAAAAAAVASAHIWATGSPAAATLPGQWAHRRRRNAHPSRKLSLDAAAAVAASAQAAAAVAAHVASRGAPL